jgi:hypothetical protein
MVTLAEGRRIKGWGKANTGSFEVAMISSSSSSSLASSAVKIQYGTEMVEVGVKEG